MKDWTGKQLGNYRMLRLLDSGGFADVYLAEHVYLKTLSAAKVLHMRLFEEDQRQHFLDEARLVARLKHPHIIQVLDFGVEDHQPFLVMDYASLGNVRQRHPEGSRISIALVLSYVQQTAAALQYAHDQHLIHRDIKPENLLLGKHNEILLSDFGIAIVARSSHSQAQQAIVGTTTYMAPEQIRGRPRVASDQYALAVLAYEWLSGAPPFQGTTDIEIARQHLTDAPPSLFKRAPDIAPAVAAVISRALAKDYRQRFASVQEFAEALAEAHATGALPSSPPDISAPETPLGEQTGERQAGKLARRRLSRRVAIGLVGGGAAITALGWQAFHSQPTPPVAQSTSTFTQPALSPAPTPMPTATRPAGSLGQQVYTFTGHNGSIDAVSWSPDSRNIVSGCLSASKPGGTIYVWDALHGTVSTTRTDYLLGDFTQNPRGGGAYNQGLAWSHKGQYIASNSLVNDAYYVVSLWTPADGNTVGSISATGVLAWSPDDRHLAIGFIDGSLSAQIVTVSSGAVVARYSGHQAMHRSQDGKTYIVNSIAWSPNGQYIATCGADNTVQVWHAFTGAQVATYTNALSKAANSCAVFNVAWSPNGKYVATAWTTSVDIFEAMTGQLVYSYQQPAMNPQVLAWSPEGTRLAIGSFVVSILDFQSRRTLFTYSGHTSMVTALTWSPSGQLIASGSYDRTVQVWIAS